MNRMMMAMLLAQALLARTAGAEPGQWDLTGFAGIEQRQFSGASASSATAQSEFYWRSQDTGARFAAALFGRADSDDRERTHLDLREASFGFIGDGWDLNAGISKVFWGVTESRHLVDVINQTDLIEDIDEEDKLGQPMVNLNLERDFGRIELYLLPRFRERTFAGPDGRLRTPIPVDSDAALFESRDGQRHRDVSLRYSHYVGDVDFGVYVFDGTSREPLLVPAASGESLVPVYEQMRQAGVDIQLTRDAWLLKFEAIARETVNDSFTAAVAGLEYTFFGARGSAADVGVLFEILYDGRSDLAPSTAFDNDIFFGARLAFNDVGDTSILAGAALDTETHETFVNLEVERRIGDSLRLDARLRVFNNSRPGETMYFLQNDDYVEAGFSWYY